MFYNLPYVECFMYAWEKKMCILLLLGVLWIWIRSNLYILLFWSSLFLLIFSLVVPSSNESTALKSLMIIVELSISTLNSVSLCFIYFRALLGASVQFSSVAQSCPTLCNPMNRSTPGLPVHHQLPEFTQTHVRWVGDAIQPSHPCRPLLLLPSIFPSIRVFSKESAFTSGGQSIGVSVSTSVLPVNMQDWSLGWTGWISLQSKGLSRVFSNITVQKHQFFHAQLSL